MSGGQRLILIIGAVLLLGAGLVLLAPGDDDETGGEATVTAPAPTAEPPAATGTTPTATEPAAPPPPPAPAFETIEVRAGKPVGGVKTITIKSGERARIEVRSTDESADEVHLHGYDISRDLEAGGRVRFSFDANAEGIFEMELEGTATEIAKLEVEP